MTLASAGVPRVFLSYSRQDTLTAEHLRRRLKLAGFDPSHDSASVPTEAWDESLRSAISGSDFIVAMLSPATRQGRQELELRAAIDEARTGRRPGMPLVLPCAILSPRDGALAAIIPDGLRQSHVVDFSHFEAGWRQLHASLYRAATSAGFLVPILLRADPMEDLDAGTVARMIAEKEFFSRTSNKAGASRAADLSLGADGRVVIDRGTGRTWMRSCIAGSSLPSPPHATADEESASLTPRDRRTEAQRALVAARQARKRQMRRAVDEWVMRANLERLGGYSDWRLPTVEEAMSLTIPDIREGGLYISSLFSNDEYVRTADRSKGPRMLGGGVDGWESVWVVSYVGAECIEAPEEGPFPLRFVRTDFDPHA